MASTAMGVETAAASMMCSSFSLISSRTRRILSPSSPFLPSSFSDKILRLRKHPHQQLHLRRNNGAVVATFIPRRISAKEGNERGNPSDGRKRDLGRTQKSASKSPGLRKKDRMSSIYNSKEQVSDLQDVADDSLLSTVVKVYCTHTEPDYSLPWQKQKQYTSTSSAFMIGDGKLLTNAHCVEHHTQVKVKRRGDGRKFVAKVLATGVECDIALLSVENEEFWKDVRPLRFGSLPSLQDSVTVIGYPLGGDTISVTMGVVSRIEVTPYAHGYDDLLGIQIDAAINPGNSGGPAFNDKRECIGIAFQVFRTDDTENIGYVIPTLVISHFLKDFERSGKYNGFPCLGVLLQNLENPALRACLKVPSDEGVLVRKIEPTSPVHKVLKEGDVIVSFDGIRIGNDATVPFRKSERIAFCYLVHQKFSGDVVELDIIRNGQFMKIKSTVHRRVNLVPYHIEGGKPSYLIIAGLVFTPLSEPLIDEDGPDAIGLKLLTKARYSHARFEGEQIVILSQVLADDANIGYEDMENDQVLKLNGNRIKNIRHLAHLVDTCHDKYLVFELEGNALVVLDREACATASPVILKQYGIPSERSSDLTEPYVDPEDANHPDDDNVGGSPVMSDGFAFDGLLWV